MRRKFHGEDVVHEARLSLIVHDLVDADEALEIAIQFVEETGRAVTVLDAHGQVLGFFEVKIH
jgi:hypothetical protein